MVRFPLRTGYTGNRRQTARVPLVAPLSIVHDDRTIRAASLDLSVGGAAILVDTPIPVGGDLELTMDLPDVPVITVPAVVRHARENGKSYIIGVQFGPMTLAEEDRIGRAVAARDRRLCARVAVGVTVEYFRLDRIDPVQVTASTDICPGGVRFRLVSDLDIGDPVELLIIMDGDRIAIDGTVVRIDDEDEGRFAAVCFAESARFRGDDLFNAIRSFLDDYPRVRI